MNVIESYSEMKADTIYKIIGTLLLKYILIASKAFYMI
jgi:hypothetical protein